MQGQGRAGQGSARITTSTIRGNHYSSSVRQGESLKGAGSTVPTYEPVFYHALPIPPRTPATAAAIKTPPPRHHHHSTLLRIRRILLRFLRARTHTYITAGQSASNCFWHPKPVLHRATSNRHILYRHVLHAFAFDVVVTSRRNGAPARYRQYDASV